MSAHSTVAAVLALCIILVILVYAAGVATGAAAAADTGTMPENFVTLGANGAAGWWVGDGRSASNSGTVKWYGGDKRGVAQWW